MKLSDHFTLEEATATNSGFPNIPDNESAKAMYHTAFKMEMVREMLEDKPIHVNSWFRSLEVNRSVGGARNSQHTLGEAVDFVCPEYGTPYEICQKLSQNKQKLGIDQLIYEGTWVHISFVRPPRVPRLEVLTCMADKSYQSGLILRRGE